MSNPFVAGAIRRILKQQRTVSPEPCPDANELSAWMESRLTPKESARFEAHASRCADCQQALALFFQLSEPSSAAAKDMAKQRGFSYRYSPIRLAFAGVLVILIGVLLFQATRQATVTTKMPEVARNPASEVISGGPGAVMTSHDTDAKIFGITSSVINGPAPSTPNPLMDTKAETAFLASQRPQAPVNSEAPKRAAGELRDMSLQKNQTVDAIAAPPIPLNEAKAVPSATISTPANQLESPLSMSNLASNSVLNSALNVQNLPTQQAGGQADQAQAAVASGQAIVGQQANISQQANLSQQAMIRQQANAKSMRMDQGMAAAEIGRGKGANLSVPKVQQALYEVKLLVSKNGKEAGLRKIGSRSFYRTSNFWVDSESMAHPDAVAREIARDSVEFRNILAKEKELSDLKEAPIVFYWNTANCLVR